MTATTTTTTTTTTAGHTNTNYENSLCLTFLRGLEFPELLGMADTLWHELERRLSRDDHRDLQQMLRAAVLTLRKQYLLPIVDVVGLGHPSEHQPNQSRHQRQRAGAHAIVQRLLPLLLLGTATTKDPWDGFFWRQSAGLIVNNHHSEGE